MESYEKETKVIFQGDVPDYTDVKLLTGMYTNVANYLQKPELPKFVDEFAEDNLYRKAKHSISMIDKKEKELELKIAKQTGKV